MKRFILIGCILLFLGVPVAVSWGWDLCADFGTGAGIWKWDGSTWSQVTPNAPTAMAASGSLLYGNFGTGAGIWKWDGTTWSQITPNSPTAMAASGSLLYGNFGTGAGIWKWDGTTWSQVTPNAPTAMAASGSLLYGNFGTGAGIWKWDGTIWSQVTPNSPTDMTIAGPLLYGNFGTGAGIWKWDGASWSQVTPNAPTAMAIAGSQLYGNFGSGAGIWKWDGTIWSQVTPNAPAAMAASGSILYGNFGAGAGIWKYDGSTWSQVTPNSPITMVTGYTPENHAPTATGGKRPVFAGTSAALVPWVVDPYLWDTFNLQVLSQPLNGTSSVLSNKLVYTPGTAFTSGTDNFTYTARDQFGDTVNGTAAVRVYSSGALSYCTRISSVNPDGTINLRTNSNFCTFYSMTTTRMTDTGAPVTMDYFINWPSNGSAPKALVVLIGGGDFNMYFSGNTTTGVADLTGGANFVVRTAQLFAEAGYVTVAINRPSDQPPEGSTDSYADASQYRISVKHAVDILTILKEINTQNLDVFLAGHSAGTMSAVAANLIAAAVSLSSPVTIDNNPDHLYIGKPGIAGLQPSFVKRPVHVLWPDNDLCSVTPPAGAQALYDSLTSYTSAMYNIASGATRVTTAGYGYSPGPCNAFDYHQYTGIEPTAVGYVTNWLNTQVAARAGNNRPEAAFATVTTPSGVTKQTDLAALTRDKDGDSLSYDLSHVTTSLGGSVTLNGSTVTYTPPVGVTNKPDYYVYVVTDSKGSVGAGVITVQIQ